MLAAPFSSPRVVASELKDCDCDCDCARDDDCERERECECGSDRQTEGHVWPRPSLIAVARYPLSICP